MATGDAHIMSGTSKFRYLHTSNTPEKCTDNLPLKLFINMQIYNFHYSRDEIFLSLMHALTAFVL